MSMQSPRYALAAAVVIAALPPSLAAPARGAEVAITVRLVEAQSDRGIDGAEVEIHPDRKAPLTPERPQRNGEYVFKIRTPATCFALNVYHGKYLHLDPLYGFSAHTNQTITIVLFPKPPGRLNAMTADEATAELAALQGRADFPWVVGNKNVSDEFLTTLTDPDLLKQLKEVAEDPNKEWGGDADILSDKAKKILDDVNKLPGPKSPPDLRKPVVRP